MKAFQGVGALLKNSWMRIVLRGERPKLGHPRFNGLYILRNPWHMDSITEQYRFIETNRIILNRIGRVDTILEIGCGEGHQSLYLRQACRSLVGLYVSSRAVRRARRKCPDCTFLMEDIFSKVIAQRAPFDLITACEVLYYINDVPAAIRQMSALARTIVVTYFQDEMENLDAIILSLPGSCSEVIKFEHCSWRIAWFRGST